MSITKLDDILAGEADAVDGSNFLDLMCERRLAFWESKPVEERSHYQGFENAPEVVVRERLLIQLHAELSAGNIPLAALEYIPWFELKADFARQVHDEFVHFKLIAEYFKRHFGGVYPQNYQPRFQPWKDLLSVAHTGDYQISADPATRIVARSVVLQFGIEGWDVEHIHPEFMKECAQIDPEMFDIFESRIIDDERLHAENGDRVLLRCDRDRELQCLAIRNLDLAMLYHHRANVEYPKFFRELAEQAAEPA